MNYYLGRNDYTGETVIISTERDFVKCSCCDDGVETYDTVAKATIAARKDIKDDIKHLTKILRSGKVEVVYDIKEYNK